MSKYKLTVRDFIYEGVDSYISDSLEYSDVCDASENMTETLNLLVDEFNSLISELHPDEMPVFMIHHDIDVYSDMTIRLFMFNINNLDIDESIKVTLTGKGALRHSRGSHQRHNSVNIEKFIDPTSFIVRFDPHTWQSEHSDMLLHVGGRSIDVRSHYIIDYSRLDDHDDVVAMIETLMSQGGFKSSHSLDEILSLCSKGWEFDGHLEDSDIEWHGEPTYHQVQMGPDWIQIVEL